MHVRIGETYSDALIGRVTVYLNDNEVEHCVEACEKFGWIEVFVLDAQGRYKLSSDGNNIETVKKMGTVKIELKEEYKPTDQWIVDHINQRPCQCEIL